MGPVALSGWSLWRLAGLGFTKLGWCGNNKNRHLVDGPVAALDDRFLGALEHTYHLHFTLARLGSGVGNNSQDGTGCNLPIGGSALLSGSGLTGRVG